MLNSYVQVLIDPYCTGGDIKGSVVIIQDRLGQACYPQSSRQSARIFLQSSELGPPTPSPVGECLPPFGSQGAPALTCGKGGGGSQFGREDRHCGALQKYMYFVMLPDYAFIISEMFTQIAKSQDDSRGMSQIQGILVFKKGTFLGGILKQFHRCMLV